MKDNFIVDEHFSMSNVDSPTHYNQGELEVIDILEDQLTAEQFI